MRALNETPFENVNDRKSEDSVEISDLSVELEESNVGKNPNPLGLQPHRFGERRQ